MKQFKVLNFRLKSCFTSHCHPPNWCYKNLVVDKVSVNKSTNKQTKAVTFTTNIMVFLHYSGPIQNVPTLHHTWNALWHSQADLTNCNTTSSYWTHPARYLKRSPSEANSCSVRSEIPSILLCTLKVSYHVPKSLALVLILSQITPIYILPFQSPLLVLTAVSRRFFKHTQ
jgi:hypothetical protein